MVHKPKSQQNSKPQPRTSNVAKNEPKSPRTTTQRFLQSRLENLNAFAESPNKADPSRYHRFYLIDRDWLTEIRKTPEKRNLSRMGPINHDLLKDNYYKLPEVFQIDGSKHILKNDLTYGYEVEILTEDAWNYLTSFYQGFPIYNSFEVDEDGRWSERYRFLSFNLVLCYGNKPPTCHLVQIPEARFGKDILKWIGKAFEFVPEGLSLAQLDSRLSLNELLEGLSKGSVPGREIDQNTPFFFKYLKDFDIVMVYSPEQVKIVDPSLEVLGACAKCREVHELRYNCACVINSYCSIDCKCSDFMSHRWTCKEFIQLKEDIEKDLSPLKNNPRRDMEVGLINIGNSCYLNCLLQILKTVPAIENDLLGVAPAEISGSAFVLGFYHAMFKLHRFPGSSIRPWPFKLSLGLISSGFMNSSQHDASEALDFILNDLDSSKVAAPKAVSDTFKGTTVGQFQCKDCKKIQVREVEDPFFLFQVPLIQEPPAKEFIVTTLNENELGFKGLDTRVGLKNQEFTLNHLAGISLNLTNLPNFLVSAARKDETVHFQDDTEFQNFVFEKRVQPNTPLHITLQTLSTDSKFFLLTTVTQVYIIGGKYKQTKSVCPPRFLQVDAKQVTPEKKISFLDIHLRVFRTMKAHLFYLFPEMASIYREAIQREYIHAEEAFYAALFQIKPEKILAALPKNPDKMEIEEENAKEAEFFVKFVQDIRYALAERPELKTEKFYTICLTHGAYKCEACGVMGGNSCAVDCLGEKGVTFSNGSLGVVKVSIELFDGSKLSKHFQTISDQENARNLKSGPVDRQSFYLKTALSSVFAWESIERKCEGCGSNNSTMQTSIKKHPEVLILHLKRFKQDYDRYGNLKVLKRDDYVYYDFEMTIEGRAYELMGVVNHVGNLNDGHYTCTVVDQKTGGWWEFNDESAVQLKDRQTVRSKSNYILFYRLLPEIKC